MRYAVARSCRAITRCARLTQEPLSSFCGFDSEGYYGTMGSALIKRIKLEQRDVVVGKRGRAKERRKEVMWDLVVHQEFSST